MGWRWQEDPRLGTQSDPDGYSSGIQGWVWVDGVPSQGRMSTDSDGNPSLIPPPPDPSGNIVQRTQQVNDAERGQIQQTEYVDSGSGVALPNQGEYAWGEMTRSLRAMMGTGTPQQQISRLLQSGGTQMLATAMGLGFFSPEVQAEWGPWIAARQAEGHDLSHFGLQGVFNNPESFISEPIRGVGDTIENIDDRPFDPAGIVDSFRGDPEAQPIDRIVQGPIADTGALELGRMYGRAFAGLGATVGANAAFGPGGTGAGDASLAGGGEVGSGYPASAPGAEGGFAGGGLSPSELGMEGYYGNPSEIGMEGSIGGPSAAAGGTASPTGGISAAGGGTAAGGAAGGSALSRLLDGGGTASDWLDLAGRLAPSVLGAYASNEQSKDLAALGDKYFNVGAPSRARYEASYAPGFSMAMDPGYTDALDQTTKSFLHKASITGNPADSPNAWQQTLKDVNSQLAYPALQDYRRTNAGTGGLAALTSAAPGLDTQSVNAQKGVYDAIGAGAADIFNPPKSLSDILRDYRRYA